MSNWVAKNNYLTTAEMENNAGIVRGFFEGKQGWTPNAVAALLGNMQGESTINPGLWESLIPYGGGYGLVQWTPYTVYSNWAGPGWQNNGTRQCERIMHEYENGGQWYPTAEYPQTFEEWAHSTDTPENLAYAFMYNYERPASLDHPERKEYARAWYEWFDGKPIDPDIPGAAGSLPPWLMKCFRRI